MRRSWLGGIVFVGVVLVVTVLQEPAWSHKPITTAFIYKKEIAQIFQKKCFQCHSEDNLAMSLTTYELARPWARAIREEILDRKMPPWSAMTGFGHFANDVSLTDRERDIILSWADGGAPSGVLKVEESIPPVFVPAAPIWDAGQPDEILTATAPFTVDANTAAVNRFEVRAAFAEPRAVKGLSFRPGNRRVVRYASVYELPSRRWLWTWTPTHTWMKLPEGVAYRLPARARLAIEVGYKGTEETVTDKSELGLYFDAAKTSQEAASLVVAAAPMEVKPGAGAQRVRAEVVVPDNRRGLIVWPELGEGAASVELTAMSADGLSEPLLWAKDYRTDWPSPFVLLDPVALGRGTRLVMTAYYKNPGDRPLTAKPSVTLVTVPARVDATDSRARSRR